MIFKCLTTHCVHLLALRRFVARSGTPAEILSDQRTNFRGAQTEREIKEAFAAMVPKFQERLAKNQIRFEFNSPAAPRFGGAWEHVIQSVKRALQFIASM